MVQKVIIMGAAGRDFHNFNVHFRQNPAYEVVAFTAAQIPGIEGKIYPPHLSGPLYPGGIPIHAEEELADLIEERGVDLVVFAYSDLPHLDVMHKASAVLACGAGFQLMGPRATQLNSRRQVISVCATRTGCGKSQTSRKVMALLKEWGHAVVAVRHAMPYGNLEKQAVQRFEKIEDLKAHDCTLEEMEEYEPYLEQGGVVYAGVDYQAILEEAEKEADLILWDGGNNDTPFFRSDLEIVVTDPHRAGHELSYFPGEVNLRRAQVIIINKVDTADYDGIRRVRENIQAINPRATVIEAASPLFVAGAERIRGQRVLVIEDGPTLTHGDMRYGAGVIAAQRFGAREIVDPRPWLKGSLKDTFKKYPSIGPLLPAMGYGERQIRDLKETIAATECDLVLVATPVDLGRVLKLDKPALRVRYELQEIGQPNLETVLAPFAVSPRKA